jgi:hypothetical protein
MPRTLPAVSEIVSLLASLKVSKLTLLVVPGADWDAPDCQQLRRYQDLGYRLAGHGWRHACRRRQTLWHKVHGWVLSRDAAEHLSCARDQIRDVVRRSFEWFAKAGLEPPRLYVPPAWAMGCVTRSDLRQLPFRWYEYLTGIYDAQQDRFRRSALVGFEADSAARALPLRALNSANVHVAARLHIPLRLAIHPYDLEHRLANQLRHLLHRPRHDLFYEDLWDDRPSKRP